MRGEGGGECEHCLGPGGCCLLVHLGIGNVWALYQQRSCRRQVRGRGDYVVLLEVELYLLLSLALHVFAVVLHIDGLLQWRVVGDGGWEHLRLLVNAPEPPSRALALLRG